MVIDIGFVGHRTLLWSFRPSFQWLGATASRSTWNRLDGAHTNQHLHPVSPLYEKERKRERMNRRIASNGHDGVTIESWREREKEREIEGTRKWRKKRTMVWIRVKRDRKKGRWWGKGGMWQRWELYRPRRTAGLYPLSSLCPHHLALWNEHYTSRWRTVEEYPRYFFLAQPRDSFYVFLPPSLSFCSFLFFPSVFHSSSFCLCYLFFPFYAYHSLPYVRRSRQASFFFLFPFYRSTFFLQFSRLYAYSRFRGLLVAGWNPDERKGEKKTKNGKRNVIEGGSKGAVARKACIRGGVKLWGVRIGCSISVSLGNIVI